MFIIYHSHTLIYLNAPYPIIPGFDMFYGEIKELCREAWQEKHNYLLLIG